MNVMVSLRTPEFLRFGAIKNPEMTWTRRWHKPGAFVLNIPYREGIEYDQLVSKGIECGIVENIVINSASDQGKDGDTMEIAGPLLAGYANRRIVWGTQSITGTPETVMKSLVSKNMGADADADRRFSGLTVQASQGFTGDSLDYQSTDTKLVDELSTLSENSGIGYDIVLDGVGMTFRALQGLNRVASQSANPRAAFSIEKNNLINAEFELDGQKHTNVAKVSSDLYTEVFGTATGYARREVFVKPTKLDKDEDGNANSEAAQRSLMLQQGEQKLTAMTLSFTCKIDPNANLKYKTNYDLGDICTCGVKRWGVSLDARITEVKEIYNVEGLGLEVTFGTGQLTYAQLWRIANG